MNHCISLDLNQSCGARDAGNLKVSGETTMNKSYAKGYRFEIRVRNYLRSLGYLVFRQGKSSFPDLICISKHKSFVIECKVNKYICAEERRKLDEITKDCNAYIAYNDKGKIKFCTHWYEDFELS